MDEELLKMIVDRYRQRIARYKTDVLAVGASPSDLSRVNEDAVAKLGDELDPEYLALAALADGIGADGSRIFSTTKRVIAADEAGKPTKFRKWIIEQNLDWRSEEQGRSGPKDWIIYGTGEMEFIIWDRVSRQFQLRSRTGWDNVIAEFSTFSEMVREVFRYSLELEEDQA